MASTDPDIHLVDAFRSGDEAAFNQIVLRYQERLFWVAYRLLNDHQSADDVVQDVFVKTLIRLHENVLNDVVGRLVVV